MWEVFVSQGGVRMLDLIFLPELFQQTGSRAADSDSFGHWDLLASQEVARRSQPHDQALGSVSSDGIGIAALDDDCNPAMSVGMAPSTSGSDVIVSDDIDNDFDSQPMSLVSVSAESSQLPLPRDSSLNVLIRWPGADNGGDGGCQGLQSVHAASNPGDTLAEQAAFPRLNHKTFVKELCKLDANALQTKLSSFSHRELVATSVMCLEKIAEERSVSATLKGSIKTKNQQLRRLNTRVEKLQQKLVQSQSQNVLDVNKRKTKLTFHGYVALGCRKSMCGICTKFSTSIPCGYLPLDSHTCRDSYMGTLVGKSQGLA